MTNTVKPSVSVIQVFLFLLASLTLSQHAAAETSAKANSELPQVRLETTEGVIELMLRPDVAPETVSNFIDYAESGFYNGTVFHRVIPGFMIQAGGFDRDLNRKDTKQPIRNEGSATLKNLRGTIAMARTGQPHSATSQFFINVVDNGYLNTTDNPKKWGYAVFGKVTDGMGVVDAIASKQTGYSGGMADVPTDPVIIERVTVIRNGDQPDD
ncbi:MAG: peptidylprolyl isomerase [Pseudomonadota bacterium]